MQEVKLSDELFQGAISLEKTVQGVMPWRIPFREIDLFPPDAINGKAAIPAGVRLHFISDTRQVGLHVVPSDGKRLFDCVVNGDLRQTVRLSAHDSTLLFDDLPGGRQSIEIYLPQTDPVTVTNLFIQKASSFELPKEKQPRWISYGSSITQCATAASPAQTWPAIVARQQELHLTCLGYSGNCHVEPMLARMIRDLPADFISLCLGINVYGANSLNLRTFRAMVIGFIQIIREKHRKVPLLVMSPIYSEPREETENAVGLTLTQMRNELELAVQDIQQLGDLNLHYVNGLEVFGADYSGYLPDQLHPDAEGYRIMGSRFGEMILERNIVQRHKVGTQEGAGIRR